jgi:hypothetical protein
MVLVLASLFKVTQKYLSNVQFAFSLDFESAFNFLLSLRLKTPGPFTDRGQRLHRREPEYLLNNLFSTHGQVSRSDDDIYASVGRPSLGCRVGCKRAGRTEPCCEHLILHDNVVG